MYKHLFMAVLGLVGILTILPLITQAYEDGIYTGVDENGNEVKTVIFGGNDTFSGVELTIKMENQEGTYRRGFNQNIASSYSFENTASGCTGTYLSGDGKLAGCTNGIDNARGGSGDKYENGFNPTPDNSEERQGPCDSGYHVPSRGERNALAIAWCNIDTGCNATYYDDTTNPTGDLRKASNWTSGNQLIYISKAGLGTKFMNEFKMSDKIFWSSSPDQDNVYYSWNMDMNNYRAGPTYNYYRSYSRPVRCLRNSIIAPAPQTFTLTFLTGGVEVRSGVAISGSVYTGDVPGTGSEDPIPNMMKDGYDFDGWYLEGESEAFDFSGTSITGNLELYAKWTATEYTISYELNSGVNNENNVTGYTIEDEITFKDATREGYKFEGWFSDANFTTGIASIPVGTTGDITLYAKWTKIETKPSGGNSGGGGGSSKTSSDSENKNDTGEKIPPTPLTEGGLEQSEGQNDTSLIKGGADPEVTNGEAEGFTPEFQEAYEFAKGNGITTMPTIQKANMEGNLTRIAMAKMLSQYAINVLGQTPDTTQNNKFNDVTEKMDSDYDDGVTLAYQLGIMGQNMPGNNFRPNDEVTRAEFATALSRMAYGTSDGEYKGTGKYYTNHMSKLVKEGIITKDDPKMKELRGYVMIMLMRSAK